MSNALQEFDEHVRGFAQSKHLSDRDLLANFAVGLSGETGEVADVLKKHLYHGDLLDRVALTKELGDAFWYWFALLQAKGFPTLRVFQGGILASLENRNLDDFDFYTLKLAVKAGDVARIIFDHIYLKKRFMSQKFQFAMFELFECLYLLAKSADLSLETVLKANIEKLQSRHGGTAFNREVQRLNKALEESDRHD